MSFREAGIAAIDFIRSELPPHLFRPPIVELIHAKKGRRPPEKRRLLAVISRPLLIISGVAMTWLALRSKWPRSGQSYGQQFINLAFGVCPV
jgi:hypothetical protein